MGYRSVDLVPSYWHVSHSRRADDSKPVELDIAGAGVQAVGVGDRVDPGNNPKGRDVRPATSGVPSGGTVAAGPVPGGRAVVLGMVISEVVGWAGPPHRDGLGLPVTLATSLLGPGRRVRIPATIPSRRSCAVGPADVGVPPTAAECRQGRSGVHSNLEVRALVVVHDPG